MSYIKTNWIDGDIITTNRLNNIEQGISNMEVVKTFETTYSYDESTDAPSFTDINYLDIKNSLQHGELVFVFINWPEVGTGDHYVPAYKGIYSSVQYDEETKFIYVNIYSSQLIIQPDNSVHPNQTPE